MTCGMTGIYLLLAAGSWPAHSTKVSSSPHKSKLQCCCGIAKLQLMHHAADAAGRLVRTVFSKVHAAGGAIVG